jgi:hypothetical protein
MEQQVIIRSQTNLDLKALVEAAIQRELKAVQHELDRSQAKLTAFEQRYGLSSAELMRRYQGRQLERGVDLVDWWDEIQTSALLQQQKQALETAHCE